MTRTTPTTPRKSASQERSRLMVETLLDATARVLTEEGYDRASTNRIAAVAGVSIGSLYQYFPNKEALVAALVTRHSREMLRILNEAMEEAVLHDLETSVRKVVVAMIDAHRVAPALHRVFDEQVPRLGQLAEIEVVEREGFLAVRRYFERHRHEIEATDLDRATFICVTAVEALTHEIVIHRADPGEKERGEFAEEITRLIVGYLRPRTEGAVRGPEEKHAPGCQFDRGDLSAGYREG